MTTKAAYDHLQQAIQDDSEYAWSWHCNLAMPIQDAGVDHATANKAAAGIMRHLFKADVERYAPTHRARG